jgi:flagellar motor switch protein FliN
MSESAPQEPTATQDAAASATPPPVTAAAPTDTAPTEEPAVPTASAEAATAIAEADPSEEGLDQVSIEELLRQASFDDPNALGVSTAAPDATDFKLPNFQQVIQDAQVSSIDLLRDVDLNVKIELGRARMLVEDVLKLTEGSVVELDKLAGDPVDVFVNDRLIARGEVLVLNDNFCVRVNEIVAGVKEEGL